MIDRTEAFAGSGAMAADAVGATGGRRTAAGDDTDTARRDRRLLDWIWTIRGSIALPPGQNAAQAFDRLDPFFREPGTSYDRAEDVLTFTKKDQAAQDRMSIYDAGILWVETVGGSAVLRYRMTSRALLFCFLAPLLFLAFGQLTVAVGMLQGASSEAADKKKDEKDKDEVRQLHPIDQALGAPAPEKPKKDDKSKEEDDKPSPTAAYVLAALFAALWAVGRVLEAWLIKTRFRRTLEQT